MNIIQNNNFNFFIKKDNNSIPTNNKFNFLFKNTNYNTYEFCKKPTNAINKRTFCTHEVNFLGSIKDFSAEAQTKIIEQYRLGDKIKSIRKMLLELMGIDVDKTTICNFVKKQDNYNKLLKERSKNKEKAKKDNIKIIMEMLVQRISIVDIAKKIGKGESYVRACIREDENNHQKYLQIQEENKKAKINEAIKMAEDGVNFATICETVGLGKDALKKYIQENEDTQQRFRQASLVYKEKIANKAIEMAKKGFHGQKLAEELGICKGTLLDYLRDIPGAYEQYQQAYTQYVKDHIATRKEVTAKVVEMTKKGIFMQDIAKELGISKDDILLYLREDKEVYHPFQHNKIKQMLKKGYRINIIAKEFNYSEDELMSIIKGDNVLQKVYNNTEKLRHKTKPISTKDLREIRRLHKQGVFIVQIAKSKGLPESTVQQAIREQFKTQEEYDAYCEDVKANYRSRIRKYAIKRANKGLNKDVIAQELGITTNTLSVYFREDEQDYAKYVQAYTQYDKEHIAKREEVTTKALEMTKKGMLMAKISEELNISQNDIFCYLREKKVVYQTFQHSKIKRMLNDGYFAKDIAKEFRFSEAEIINIIEEDDVLRKVYNKTEKLRSNNSSMAKVFEEAKILHRQGVSIRQIAIEKDLSETKLKQVIMEQFKTKEEYEAYCEEVKANYRSGIRKSAIKMAKEGLDKDVIAQKLGISESTLTNYFKENKQDYAQYVQAYTQYEKNYMATKKEVTEKTLEMTNNGMLMEDISRELNIPKSDILKYLMSVQKVYVLFQRSQINQMLNRGYSIKDIAKEFDCSENDIMDIIKKSRILLKVYNENLRNKQTP